jgi:hypothetical protein
MTCSPPAGPRTARPAATWPAAVEVRRDRREVLAVHRERVVELGAERERDARRGRRDEHVGLLEGGGEVAGDERADLLRLAVVGVVVAARQGVGAEDDPALDLRPEAGVAGQRHDLLERAVAVVADAQAVADAVERARLDDASDGAIR